MKEDQRPTEATDNTDRGAKPERPGSFAYTVALLGSKQGLVDLKTALSPIFYSLCAHQGCNKGSIKLDTYLKFANEFGLVPDVCPSLHKLKKVFQ